MPQIGSNFQLTGTSPNFSRDQFQTIALMAACTVCDEGHLTYCVEDSKRYEFHADYNSATTGHWKEYKSGSTYTHGDGIQEIDNTLEEPIIAVDFGVQDALITELFSDTSWADGDLVELNPDGGFNFVASVEDSEYDKVYGIRYVRLKHGGAIGSSDNAVTTANVVAIILDGDRHTFDTPLPFKFSGTGVAKVQMPAEFVDRVILGVIIQPTADYSASIYHFLAANSSGLIRFKEYSAS